MNRFVLLLATQLFITQLLFATDRRGDTLDIVRTVLNLDFTDFSTRQMKASASITLRAKQNGVEFAHLDLLKLPVDSVVIEGFSTIYSYNDSVLSVYLLNSLQQNDTVNMVVHYSGTPYRAPGDFGGFYWSSTYAFNIGVSFLADPHTYGRVWFPCYDNFEERSLFEFYITTRSNHKAFCNGLLLSETTVNTNKVWHWKLNQEIQSYLASVAVAPYATLPDTVNGVLGTIPIELAALPTDTTQLKTLFVHLKDAFHIQEEMWGPYRWDRIGYCIVPFTAGAMEHATNIGFMQYYLSQIPEEAESTMAHELSHHWFGDLVTCATADEMWLNEGWASYNEYLFSEKFYGRGAYMRDVKDNHEYVLRQAHVSDGGYYAVSGVPTNLTYGRTVYDKGADVCRAVRAYMGDSLFFTAIRSYLNHYAFSTATTAQFRDYLQLFTSANLTSLFDDWVYQPGFAHFEIDSFGYNGSANLYNIFVRVKQRMHHADHLYQQVPIIITCIDSAGNRYDYRVVVNGACTELTFTSTVSPQFIALDIDENLPDAVTDEIRFIDTVGVYDFNTAYWKLSCSIPQTRKMLRVEHHWVAPVTSVITEGFQLHNSRYWTIDGPFNDDADVGSSFFTYGAAIDSAFLTGKNEDSLVLLYREKPWNDWRLIDTFILNTRGNVNDRIGDVTIPHTRKGQYTLALRNVLNPTQPISASACNTSGLGETSQTILLKVYPNPANEQLYFTTDEQLKGELVISDLAGRVVQTQKQNQLSSNGIVEIGDLQPGAYFIVANSINNSRLTAIFIKN